MHPILLLLSAAFNAAPPISPVIGKATRMAASYDWLCAITEGAIRCRTPRADRRATLRGDFVDLAVGLGVCGRTQAGEIRCRGLSRGIDKTPYPAPVAPAGRYTALFAHNRYACALDAAGRPTCFGEVMRNMVPFPARGAVEGFAGSASGGCVRDGKALRCWPFPLPEPVVDWTAVVVGGREICGLTAKGEIACQQTAWRHPDYGRKGDPPKGTFTRLIGDPERLACGLTATGQAHCFGEGMEYSGAVSPPADVAFETVAIDDASACGIAKGTGAVHCWGAVKTHTGATPLLAIPEGRFVKVAVENAAQACASRPTGEVVCWGNAASPTITAQLGAGPVDDLVISTSTACVRRGEAVRCGGKGEARTPPTETDFVQLDAAPSIVCGVRRTGAVVCWGAEYALKNDRFLPAPANAKHVVIDNLAGLAFSRDGALDFWAGHIREPVPAVAFADLHLGDESVCGRTVDGRAACWGWARGVGARTGVRSVAGQCAAYADGVECWRGRLDTAKPAAGITGAVRTLLPDQSGVIALMADGSVQHTDRRVHRPTGRYASIVGTPRVRGFFCGLTAAGAAECWSSIHGPIEVGLKRTYTQLVIERDFMCGLQTDGLIMCVRRPPR